MKTCKLCIRKNCSATCRIQLCQTVYIYRSEIWYTSLLATMRTVTASSLLLILGCSAVIAEPWFCHDLDCPKFTVTKKNDFYETRIYTRGAILLY